MDLGHKGSRRSHVTNDDQLSTLHTKMFRDLVLSYLRRVSKPTGITYVFFHSKRQPGDK